jgi:hypothetical protein
VSDEGLTGEPIVVTVSIIPPSSHIRIAGRDDSGGSTRTKSKKKTSSEKTRAK